MNTLSDVLTPGGRPEKIENPSDEVFVTVRLHSGGAVRRPIGSGKTPVPFTGYRVKAHQFIYSRIDARNGAFAFIPESLHGAVVSKDFPVFDVRDQVVDRSYLNHFFRGGVLEREIRARSFGATNRQRLNEEAFLRFPIALPPFDEQRRIAAILDQADALRVTRREVLDHLDRLTQSIFHHMFGHIEPDHRLRDICNKITDGTHQSPEWAPSGVPFIFISNITNGEISLETSKYVSEQTWEKLTARTPIEVGDILYSTVGSYGIPAVVRQPDRFAFQRHIAHIKPISTKVDADFLAAQLASARMHRLATRAAKGIAQPTVNLGDISNFSVCVPPLAAQAAFSEKVQSILGMKRLQQDELRLADEHFAALQSRAFRGEL